MIKKTTNPLLGRSSFASTHYQMHQMTLWGTLWKGIFLLILVSGSAFSLIHHLASLPLEICIKRTTAFLLGGAFFGLMTSIPVIFRPQWSTFLAPLYALSEGIFLGAFSFFVEQLLPNTAITALTITLSLFFTMLFLFQSGIIKGTDRLQGIVLGGFGAIFLTTLFALVISWLTGRPFMGMMDASLPSILFSLFSIIMGALSLVLDFSHITRRVKAGAPKYMEWYGALSLMITLVYLYVEVVKLLVKLGLRRKSRS